MLFRSFFFIFIFFQSCDQISYPIKATWFIGYISAPRNLLVILNRETKKYLLNRVESRHQFLNHAPYSNGFFMNFTLALVTTCQFQFLLFSFYQPHILISFRSLYTLESISCKSFKNVT